jgi:hypothetical protein
MICVNVYREIAMKKAGTLNLAISAQSLNVKEEVLIETPPLFFGKQNF